mgnify:FL=1
MKNSKKGFIVPVLLVIIALLVVGGGVYIYENKKAEVPAVVDTGTQQTNTQIPPAQNIKTPTINQQNNSATPAKNSLDISLDQILNSNGFINGVRHGTDKGGLPEETIITNQIAFGDIDGDGYKEAVVPVQWCHASCGRFIYVYKNDSGKILSGSLPEAKNTSVKQGITSITIKNGMISITKSDWGPNAPAGTNTYQVKFVNGDLRVLDSATGQYVSQNVKNANFSFIYPVGGEKFKIGSTVTIKWSASGLAYNAPVTIYIHKGSGAGSIVGETTNTGSFNWTIPASMDIGYTSLADTSDTVYRFNIQLNQSGVEHYSNRFSITR